ncbi:MAG: TIR domain-containing protein [Alphaproteobacteria bacterium]
MGASVPDVFISYARSSAEAAERIADSLRAAGYSVWKDDALPAHRNYADVIEEQLRQAKAVVVLWSADAVRSQWVRAEADLARNRGTLVQLSVDGAMPPLPFNQIQCPTVDFRNGRIAEPAWRTVEQSISELVGGQAAAAPPPVAAAQVGPSICVLPFANVSGDPEQDYFSDGISEDIITDLAGIDGLSVVSRNTAFGFKGSGSSACDVARQLGVSHVLEGSVRKSGSRVRVSAQLVDGSTGRQIWAERHDRDLTDIFEIQDEIAVAIVKALRLKLLEPAAPAVEQRGTSNAEAYNLYLMARQYWIAGNDGDSHREELIIRLCERAAAIDPNYARAWALKALAQSQLRFREGGDHDDGVAAANRALALDPTSVEAHLVKARSYHAQQLHEAADHEVELALAVEPESWEANKIAGKLLLLRGRPEEAIPYFEKAASLVDTDYHTLALLGTCQRSVGRTEEAGRADARMLERVERAVARDPSNGAALGLGASALAALGERDRAREWIERAIAVDPQNRIMRYNLACALANELGERDRALEMLAPYFDKLNSELLHHVEVDPDLDVLRDDPRFIDMLEQAKARIAAGA